MKVRRVLLGLFVWISTWLWCWVETSLAEDANIAGFSIIKIDGPYIYTGDGVPLLGWIIARLPEDKVRFVLCSSKIVQIDFKVLTASKGKCPSGQRLITPWSYEASTNTIRPARDETSVFVKAATAIFYSDAKEKKNIDVKALPKSWQNAIQTAKSDEWVGITFMANGKQSLGLITPLQ